MTEKLFNTIKDSDIRIYTLTSGKTFIGECAHAYEDGIELHCPLELKRILLKNNVYTEMLIPIIAHNDNEPCIIYDHAIESETFASDDVKRKYAEALIYNRLAQIMHSSNLEELLKEENINDESTNYSHELDKQSSQLSKEDLLNIFLDRWKQ